MKKNERFLYIFVTTYFVINILNTYLVTSNLFNKEISVFSRSFQMTVNSILGDFGVLLFFLGLGTLLFRSIKKRMAFLLWVTALASFMIFCIATFMHYFGTMFSFMNANVLNNPAGGVMVQQLLMTVIGLIVEVKIIYFTPIIVISIMSRINKRREYITAGFEFEDTTFSYLEKNHRVSGVVLMIVAIILSFNAFNTYRKAIDKSWFAENDVVLHEAQSIGMYNYYVGEFYQTAFFPKEATFLSEEQREQLDQFKLRYSSDCYTNIIDQKQYCKTDAYTGLLEGYNVLYIQLESVNSWVIDQEINGIKVMPNLHALQNDSIYFNNFFTNVGIGNTSDNEFTVNTGLYPDGSSVMFFEFVNQEFPALAKILGNNQYETYSFHGNTGEFYDRKNVHETMLGFDTHFTIDELDSGVIIHDYLSDLDVLNQTLDMIETLDNPFYIHDILVTSHLPYSKDDGIIEYDWGDDYRNTMLARYLNHMKYVDEVVGVLVTRMEEMDLLDDTLVYITGDHGATIPMDEMQILYPELEKLDYRKMMMNVPLYFINPDKLGTQNIDLVRSPADLYRTTLNLLGVEYEYAFGVNVLSNEPSFSYNPRSFDYVNDDYYISAVSEEYLQLSDNPKQTYQEYVDAFLLYKEISDRLIHTDYLNKNE